MDVIWQPRALKQVKKLGDSQATVQLVKAASKLTDFPNVANVKALSHHTYGYRLRVGNYRILFDVDDSIHVISIEEVKKRDEHTY